MLFLDNTNVMTKKSKSFVEEFMAFVKGFGVIGLALGVVIGGAASKIVASLVENIIQPLLGLVGGLESLSEWEVGVFKLGAFIGDFIEFAVLLLVVYCAVKIVVGKFLSSKEREEMGI